MGVLQGIHESLGRFDSFRVQRQGLVFRVRFRIQGLPVPNPKPVTLNLNLSQSQPSESKREARLPQRSRLCTSGGHWAGCWDVVY